jgi:hypothetical protein
MGVSPALGRHLFGGDLVVPDVCGPCNNGPLGALDEAAKTYWDARKDELEEVDAVDALVMARWSCKVAYNAQRAVLLLGTGGQEPPFPPSAPDWILSGGAPPPDVAVVMSRMPVGHRDTDGAGVFGSNGTALPQRYIQLRGSVWFIVWDPSGQSGVAEFLAGRNCQSLPAVRVGRPEAVGAVAVPLLGDPDLVRRGVWNNPALLEKLARRYPL